ncbi:hypothetical protein NQ314_019776 [Rhamnusium bicolor]|uniref:Uncharacterized protein n=1 Tax=Rhamnusium bicolor TaxID=1586634 RepID=A0AAV8WNB0_9CUCU|nr:hypothetical protein NQ314_019776 [Rhamnusium bicolor]
MFKFKSQLWLPDRLKWGFTQYDMNRVYWVGPILGGMAAALLYKNAFQAPSLGPLKIIERYTTVATDEKEVK